MIKPLFAVLFTAFTIAANAQTGKAPFQEIMPYGKIDIAELQLKSCDFEPDANAEVLFNKGDVYFDSEFTVITNEVHKRIKIFNDNGKKEADIRIPYYGGNQIEFITGVQAETINLVDGKIEITKLDKKLIYDKTIDKQRNEIVFYVSKR